MFELPGCRERGTHREGGRFLQLDHDEREQRIEELIESSQKLVGRINADQAELASNTTELLGLFQASQGWGWGWRTPAHRLACQLKLTGAEARRLVAVADRLPDLPELSAAFEHGEVSMPVAAALADVATPETEADLVEQSRHATADAMVGVVSTFKRGQRAAGEAPERTESLSLRPKADGFEVRGFLNATNGELVSKLLEQRRQELFEQSGKTATSAAALLSLLELGPRPPTDRFLAVLQIDVDVFRAWQERRSSGVHTCADRDDQAKPADGDVDPMPTGVSIQHGPPVTEAELDAIHGELSALWMVTRDGHPLWVSSKARVAPPWMRRAMAVEQRCCGAAGCDRAGVLEAHHSVPFTKKPETLFSDMVFLCPFHHRALHAAGATVEFSDDRSEIVIRDHRGRIMALTGVPIPPEISPKDRSEWSGRGVWTAGMETYDSYGTDVVVGHLQAHTPPAATSGSPPTFGSPPTGGGHPADPDVTGGDNGGSSPPQA